MHVSAHVSAHVSLESVLFSEHRDLLHHSPIVDHLGPDEQLLRRLSSLLSWRVRADGDSRPAGACRGHRLALGVHTLNDGTKRAHNVSSIDGSSMLHLLALQV